MKLYRYKKDGHLYTLYQQLRPFYNLVSVNECIDDLADQIQFWILRNKK